MKNSENIDAIISSGNYPPVLLLFGEEDYLLETDFRRLIEKFVATEEDKYNFDLFDGNDASLEQIAGVAAQYPMMSDRRVVAVKNFGKLFAGRKTAKSDKNQALLKYLENPLSSTFLILSADVDKLKGLKKSASQGQDAKVQKQVKDAGFPYDLLINQFSWNEYPKVWENEVGQWISGEAKKMGKSIPMPAAELLAAQTGTNLRELSNEINKLILYAKDKKEIGIDDVTAVSGLNREFTIFELQKAIGTKNLKKSLNILENMLSSDRQEQLIIAMLTKYFVSLWKMIELMQSNTDKFILAKELGTNPYFVQDYITAYNKYTPPQIEKALKSICETDTLLKSTPTDSFLLLEKMILSILN